MGFETQEEAERWAEGMEFRADAAREERLLSRRLNAYLKLMELPAYKDLSKVEREALKAVFDYAWDAALLPSRRADKFARDLCQALNEGDGSYKP